MSEIASMARAMAEAAMNEGQKIAFDTAISICRKTAEALGGDAKDGALLCVEMIIKLRDEIDALEPQKETP